MKKNSKVYLIDILQAAADIQTYTISAKREDLFVDRMLQDAVIRKFTVIGEAAKRLPLFFKKREKKVPWKKITGLRDIVVHDYSDIDLDVLWETIKQDLPELVQAIQRMIKELK